MKWPECLVKDGTSIKTKAIGMGGQVGEKHVCRDMTTGETDWEGKDV